MLTLVTREQVLEAWRRGGAARDRVLIELSREDALAQVGDLLAGPAEARRLAAVLLGRADRPTEALEHLECLAADEDRHTREAAAHAAGTLLARHFDEAYPTVGAWRSSPHPLVRRAVALAAGIAVDPQRLSWAEPLLRLLDPLLSDRAPEVRGAVEGTLAHAFLPSYPDDTFEQITSWSASHDPQVLWHVASALGAAPEPLVRRALIVLRRVALSEHRYVRGAVARALVRLASTSPDAVGGELRRWLTEEDRRPLAREALGKIGTDLAGSPPSPAPAPVTRQR